jgi:hypothetical protein
MILRQKLSCWRSNQHEKQNHNQNDKNQTADFQPTVRSFALNFAGSAVDDDLIDFVLITSFIF